MDFVQALQAVGIVAPLHIPNNGSLVRCKTTDHPHKKNGAFSFHGDWGWFQNWATMQEAQVWQSDKPMTEARKREIEREQAEAQYKQKQARINAVRAMRAWFEALPVQKVESEYLERKGLSNLGLDRVRMDGKSLIVPVFWNDRLITTQEIKPTGEKKFAFGCPSKGGYFVIGSKTDLTVFAEGFATGLAIYQFIRNCRVVVCFSAGNMPKVASDWMAQNKVKGLTVVACDNDYQTSNNAGITFGKQAAEIIGCNAVYPQGISGTDYDDALRDDSWGGVTQLKKELLVGAKMVF